jgi:hypothetical protein
LAVDCPAEFDAVTVSVPEAGKIPGAVYSPAEVTVPETAVQPVAPAAVNCTVLFNSMLMADGEIIGAPIAFRVTLAEDEPIAFEAVIVSVPEAGIMDGAV